MMSRDEDGREAARGRTAPSVDHVLVLPLSAGLYTATGNRGKHANGSGRVCRSGRPV